jgi:hypothetical protein
MFAASAGVNEDPIGALHEDRPSEPKLGRALATAASRVVAVLFFGLTFFLATLSLLSTTTFPKSYVERPLYRPDSPLLLLALFVALVACLFLFDRRFGIERLNTAKLEAVLLVYTLIASVSWVLLAHTTPKADQLEISRAAAHFCVGNFAALRRSGYLFVYPQQLGMSAVLELVYRVVGIGHFIAFQLLNALAVPVIFYALFRTTDVLFHSRRANNILLIMLFGCLPPILYATFVYGNVMALMFTLLAVLMEVQYLQTKRLSKFVYSAVFISAATLMKANSEIALVAMVLVFLVAFLADRDWRNIVLPVCLVAACWLSIFSLNAVYQLRSGVPIDKGTPTSVWVAMGLQDGPMAPGWWNTYSAVAYKRAGYSRSLADSRAKASIATSIGTFMQHPRSALTFFYLKFASQWNDPTYQSLWLNGKSTDRGASSFVRNLYQGTLHTYLVGLMNIYQSAVFLGALLCVVFLFRELDSQRLLLALVVLGGAVFHTVWEAKGEYIMQYFVMLVPYAAVGVSIALTKLTGAVGRVADRSRA